MIFVFKQELTATEEPTVYHERYYPLISPVCHLLKARNYAPGSAAVVERRRIVVSRDRETARDCRLACLLRDRRALPPASTTHTYADMIRARMFAIACGYEDCDDLDVVRFNPAFKLACGRVSETGDDLMSQPTLSRLEDAPFLFQRL